MVIITFNHTVSMKQESSDLYVFIWNTGNWGITPRSQETSLTYVIILIIMTIIIFDMLVVAMYNKIV